jgi:cytochrome c556
MKHPLLATLLCAAAGLTALPAAAQFQKPEDAVKYRKAAFPVMAAHFGRIGAMAQGKAPWDAQAAAANMAVIDTVHKLPFAAFGAGTDQGETKARAEIWKDAAGFKSAGDKMMAEMAKLSTAVKSGSFDNVKAAFGPVGGACKACHDDYRAK